MTLKQPWVDPDLCIGCGICEAKCVFKDIPAVRITSTNEARHPANQPILPPLKDGGGYFNVPESQGPDSAPTTGDTPIVRYNSAAEQDQADVA